MSESEIEKRLLRQLTEEQMLKLSDYVIVNEGTLEDLKKKVEKICQEIKSI